MTKANHRSVNSFRSRFRLIRHGEKKAPVAAAAPMTPKAQQTFKFPLVMESKSSGKRVESIAFVSRSAATLSPVPEADDYESSDLSFSDMATRSSRQQPLIKSERKQNLTTQQVRSEVFHSREVNRRVVFSRDRKSFKRWFIRRCGRILVTIITNASNIRPTTRITRSIPKPIEVSEWKSKVVNMFSSPFRRCSNRTTMPRR